MVPEPGRLNLALVILAGAAAAVAAVSTPVTASLQALLVGAVLLITLNAVSRTRQRRIITHDDTTQRWHIQEGIGLATEGVLIQAGYRSPVVLVLVIQSEDTTCHRIAVWQDQVPAAAFSYLHHQLAFNTSQAQRPAFLPIAGLIRRLRLGKTEQKIH